MTMDVRIDSLLAGAERASGHVVIIDVFRAFTTAAVALSREADQIIMVEDVEDALALRASGIAQLCMGEVGGRMPVEFDLGNSPFQATQMELAGKTIAQRTSAGTQGIVAAAGALRLYAGSLVTAKATAKLLRRANADVVSLVAMGEKGQVRTDEDELCAIHLRNLLEGRTGNANAVREIILAGARIADFNNPAKPHLHPEDLTIALDVDRFDFAVRINQENGRAVATIERPGSSEGSTL
jgi:2-phosphosulfolactate phosphatase